MVYSLFEKGTFWFQPCFADPLEHTLDVAKMILESSPQYDDAV